jgi:hypothetical protein
MTGKDWNREICDQIWLQVWAALENRSESLTYLLSAVIDGAAARRVRRQASDVWTGEGETGHLKNLIVGEVGSLVKEQARGGKHVPEQ